MPTELALSPWHIEAVGTLAATLTTLAFAPQSWKIIKTRDARSVSLVTHLLFLVGIILWFLYGLAHQSWPIMISNIVSFGLVASIIILKLRHS